MKIEKLLLTLILLTAAGISASAQRKPVRKPVTRPPVSQPAVSTVAVNGRDTTTGTSFSMTIEHGGEKKEISSARFETRDGNTIAAGGGRLLLFYGVSNSADAQRFSFNASIPHPQKGSFPIIAEDLSPGFSITTTDFPAAGALKARTGTIEIISMPAGEGFVEGKFSGVCEVTADQGTVETYRISGTFKLRKRLE